MIDLSRFWPGQRDDKATAIGHGFVARASRELSRPGLHLGAASELAALIFDVFASGKQLSSGPVPLVSRVWCGSAAEYRMVGRR